MKTEEPDSRSRGYGHRVIGVVDIWKIVREKKSPPDVIYPVIGSGSCPNSASTNV